MGFRAFPGARVGDYEVVTELGRGGMGQVLLARDTRIGRPVAIKILSPELADDPDFRARFLREARIAANLEHPNVVPVYDIGDHEDLLFIVMRYVPGKDLRRVLDDGPLEPARAVVILTQIASALDAAHAAGLIHRDVKPGNILLTERAGPDKPEHAYLADFGLAAQTVLSDIHTTPGTILGTIDYAPPEQLQGWPLDGRADVYALGAVLFESLTGTTPFARPTAVATIAALLSEPAPNPSEVRAQLSTALDAVSARALAKSREDRFRTCADLIAATRDAIAVVAPPTVFASGRVGEIKVGWQGAERSFHEGVTVRIGRDPTCEVVIDNPNVSRVHAELRSVGDGWVISDASSRQGTFVGGRRIESLALERTTDVLLGRPDRGACIQLQVRTTAASSENASDDRDPSTGRPKRPRGSLPDRVPAGRTDVVGDEIRIECAGNRYNLQPGPERVIGCDADCDIVCANPTVSRRHAAVRHDDRGWRLDDLASTRGTFLEGRRVQSVPLVGAVAVWLGDPQSGERVVFVAAGTRHV